MARKLFSGLLILLSVLLLVTSLLAIGATWFYKDTLTHAALSRLQAIDAQVVQAQGALHSSAGELERALRIVDATEAALQKLALENNSAESLLGNIQSTLDDRILPELKDTRGRIGTARSALERLQSVLAGLKQFLPTLDLSAPDNILKDLIESTSTLDEEIANMEVLVQQASTFVSDSSFVLGGDLTETRTSLQNLLSSVHEYEAKAAEAHAQVQYLIAETPHWADQAAAGLTLFLAWFAFSQFGLWLHGLHLWGGGNPLDVFRRPRAVVAPRLEDEILGERADY